MHVVLCTAPSKAAETLAFSIVDARLAACVNIVPGVTSVYRWQGAVQRDAESLLVIKTSADGLSRLLRELPALHPYDVPEIVALDPSDVHPPYARWVDDES
jgi:periplasmic divalent cation tolerance protein